MAAAYPSAGANQVRDVTYDENRSQIRTGTEPAGGSLIVPCLGTKKACGTRVPSGAWISVPR